MSWFLPKYLHLANPARESSRHFSYTIFVRPKKKIVMLPSPDQNLKIGSVGRDFFFFFFFTYRERVEFSNIFFKFLNGENSGGMQSKRIYKSCKCFFKPLNTNFSKFFAQIWHLKKKKKTTLFFRILRSVGRGQHNFFFCDEPFQLFNCFLIHFQTKAGVQFAHI